MRMEPIWLVLIFGCSTITQISKPHFPLFRTEPCSKQYGISWSYSGGDSIVFGTLLMQIRTKLKNSSLLVGGNSNIYYFHPGSLGRWSNLTNIFQSGWSHQLGVHCRKQVCLFHSVGMIQQKWWVNNLKWNPAIVLTPPWNPTPPSFGVKRIILLHSLVMFCEWFFV